MSSLQGPLDLERMPALLAQADALAAAGLVDLSGVQRVDSAGLSFLLELLRRARSRQQTLRFVHAPAQLQGLAAFFRVDALLGIDAG